MDTAARNGPFLDADAFLRTDQSEFGSAWRYELVRCAIVAHAPPSPEHGVILGNLAGELLSRPRGHPNCRSEVGSGAVPQYEQRDTARIPHAMIRCGQQSPRRNCGSGTKRADLQAVEGVQEIVEIYQDEMLAHAYRRYGVGWVFESIDGSKAQMALPSVGITVALAALYERVPLEDK